jgi:hypothetical protein
MKQKKNREFWVSNVSEKNVCLADLALTVPARRHINLLDSKHFSYTLEQLEKSRDSGSLFKKSRLVKVREVAPEPLVKPGKYKSKTPMFMKYNLRAAPEIEEPYFEELDVDEVSFANELTDDSIGNPFDTLADEMAAEKAAGEPEK